MTNKTTLHGSLLRGALTPFQSKRSQPRMQPPRAKSHDRLGPAEQNELLTVLLLGTATLFGTLAQASELNDPTFPQSPAAHGHFGWSVAMDGDAALVGEPGTSFGPRNLAHILLRSNSGGWSHNQTLTPAGSGIGGYGGAGLDIDGVIAVIGADTTDPSNRGAAVLFELVGSPNPSWQEQIRLAPSSGGSDRRFGGSVATRGEAVLVGAPGRVGGDLVQTVTGSAFLFERNHGGADAWGEVVELMPTPTIAEAGFGTSVELLQDLALVGSPRENDLDGAVYVFARNQGGPNAWGQVQRISLPDAATGDLYGFAVAATLIPDAPSTHWLAIGAPGRGAEGTVALYSKEETASIWTFNEEVFENEGVSGSFGAQLDIDGALLVVGNPNGPSIIARGSSGLGVVSVFRKRESSWKAVARHVTEGMDPQALGRAVAVSGERAIAGAPTANIDFPGSFLNSTGAIYAVPVPLFADGFEQGSTQAWSSTSP